MKVAANLKCYILINIRPISIQNLKGILVSLPLYYKLSALQNKIKSWLYHRPRHSLVKTKNECNIPINDRF